MKVILIPRTTPQLYEQITSYLMHKEITKPLFDDEKLLISLH